MKLTKGYHDHDDMMTMMKLTKGYHDHHDMMMTMMKLTKGYHDHNDDNNQIEKSVITIVMIWRWQNPGKDGDEIGKGLSQSWWQWSQNNVKNLVQLDDDDDMISWWRWRSQQRWQSLTRQRLSDVDEEGDNDSNSEDDDDSNDEDDDDYRDDVDRVDQLKVIWHSNQLLTRSPNLTDVKQKSIYAKTFNRVEFNNNYTFNKIDF